MAEHTGRTPSILLPLGPRLRASLRWLCQRIRSVRWGSRGRRDVWGFYNASVSHWETEYSNGKWAFMRDLPEVSRYSVIIGYITYFAHRGAVLDVGSGDGILRERLVQPLRRYVGVDISSEAIRHARRLEDAQTMFVCADVTQYDPDDTFDVIVFNEVLYYLNDPLSLLRRYERYVQPGGVFVISMHVNPKTTNNWQRLEAAYSFLDETSTTNTRSGHTWVCRVCQPLHREQPA